MSTKLTRVMVRLTEPQHAALHVEAERLGLPVNELIRRIIDAWREQKGG